MSTIVTRAGKGSQLTHTEMDANLTNLNNDKLELTDLGNSATLNTGTTAGTVATGNHTHTGVYQPASANLDEYAAVNPTAVGLALLDDATTGDQRTTLGLVIGSDVQPFSSATLKSDTTATLTKGYSATPYNAGTKTTGTFTPDEANGNFQYCVNGGAFTLAPPTNNCTLVVQITNNASAGTITTSGFTKVTGTAPVTTNGYSFFAYITKCNGFSHLAWQAL